MYLFMQVKWASYPYLVNDMSKQKYWGRVTGIGAVVQGIAMWLGVRVLMPMIDQRGEKAAYFVGALFVAVATILTLVFVKESPARSETPPRLNPAPVIWSTLKAGFSRPRNLLIFVTYAFACGVLLPTVFVPLQAKVNLGLTEGAVGVQVMQYAQMVGIFLGFLVGWAIDKIGSVKCVVIGYGVLIGGIILGYQPSWSSGILIRYGHVSLSPPQMLAVAGVIASIALGFVYNASYLFVMTHAPRKDVAMFMSCSGAINQLGQSVFMFMTGWFITHVFHDNYGFGFVTSGILVTISLPLFFYIKRSEKRFSASADPAPHSEGMAQVSVAVANRVDP
jgi:hypothetical protein